MSNKITEHYTVSKSILPEKISEITIDSLSFHDPILLLKYAFPNVLSNFCIS